jgi:signal transduction histidine kinase/ActR/RegA family two-component response regulator
MDLPTGQRTRGVVLNATGEDKLQIRMRQLDIERYPVPELVRRSQLIEGQGLHPATVRKILRGQGVDKDSIALVFKAVELELEPQDYTGARRTVAASVEGEGEAKKAVSSPIPQPPSFQADWGEAIDVSLFCGRLEELATLQQWVLEDHCRLLLLLGMGGIGKTTLATKLAAQLVGHGGAAAEEDRAIQGHRDAEHSIQNSKAQASPPSPFKFLIWRSLRHAPTLSELLDDLLKLLSGQQITDLPETTAGKLSKLIEYLRQHRCLIVLDNLETLMQGETYTGQFQTVYKNYGDLLRQVGEISHQSCFLLTSREEPDEVAMLAGQALPVRSLHLTGLKTGASELLTVKGLSGSETEYRHLIERYGGNPLAIKIISTTIQDLFGGNITDFLAAGISSFNSIRLLLSQQFDRLTETEQAVMYWLAIRREKVSLLELECDIYPKLLKHQLLETLESLIRRCLIEQSLSGFTQQPVVMEYVTERLVEQVSEEIEGIKHKGEETNAELSSFIPYPSSLLITHALLQATAKDYIREAQIRLIVQPTIAQLTRRLGSKRAIETRLAQILKQQRQQPDLEVGYGGGNLLNLLIHLGSDLSGFSFSQLPIWQAYLQGANLQRVDFAHADFARSVFTQLFGSVVCTAFSPAGDVLATGDDNGDVHLWRVADGQALLTFSGHAGQVVSVSFSANGQTLVSRGEDQTVKFWQVDSGQCFRTLQRYTSQILSVCLDADPPMLISWGTDRTIRLWNLDTGQSLAKLQGEGHQVQVALNTNGETLATAGAEETVTLWDARTGQILQTLYGHLDRIQTLAFRPSLAENTGASEMLASGSDVDLAKIEAGKMELTLSPTSIKGLCDSSLTFVKQQAFKKKIQLSAHVPPGLDTIQVDERRLRQVLINLLSNAVKFTPTGGKVWIEVEAGGQEKGHRGDTETRGHGDAENLPKVFSSEPEPPTSNLQLPSFESQASSSELNTLTSNLQLPSSEPETSGSELETSSSEPKTSTSEPETSGSELETSGSELETSSSKLKTQNSELATPPAKLPPNSQLYLSIIDTGIGISPENLSRLFQPFVQVDSSYTRRYEGTGLGLAMVQRVVELHGGSVYVESEVGKGSRFTVALPWGEEGERIKDKGSRIKHEVTRKTRENGGPQAEKSSGLIKKPIYPSSPLVLLAEDNEANIQVMTQYLEAQGYQIVLAKNGREAVEFAVTHKPDLIVMDVQMPEMDGLEATRRVRGDRTIAHTPIIAVTSFAMDSDREQIPAAGVDGYLTKPVSLRELVSEIAKHLKRSEA